MNDIEYGPRTPLAIELDEMKYRLKGESFKESRTRVANALKDNDEHYHDFRDTLLGQYFLPGGRVLSAVGAPREVTPFNCFVSMTIEDSMDSIMDAAKYAATTMRLGGGIGYDFSNIRPRGTNIVTLDSRASGPVSFMGIFDAICKTISSAGHRRGAQMGCLRVDHPDIEEFISCKSDNTTLAQFNLSVLITDEFMKAVDNDSMFQLRFDGRIYKQVRARYLWEKIMRQTWDYAEPGVIFVDRINRKNNLWYCETISATNPSMPAGTLVHTMDGIFPIESLEGKSFKVKSLDGSWADAECFMSGRNKQLIEIDFGGGKKVRSTEEHKWPVMVNGRYLKSLASDLRVGDMIPINRNEPLGMTNRPDLTYNDGLACGIVFGDGSYGKRKDDGRYYLSVHCNTDDVDIQAFISDYFGCPALPQGDECVINFTKSDLVLEWLNKVGLPTEGKDRIPPTLWGSNDEFIRGFVSGIFGTDGWVRDDGNLMQVTNKSVSVLTELGKLLSFHGINVSIQESVTKLNGNEYPRADLVVNSGNITNYLNVFDIFCDRKRVRLSNRIPARKHVSSSHQVVKAIKYVGSEDVWDISVYHDQHVFPCEWSYTGNCGEQPLAPHAACLLGSMNLTKFIETDTTGDRYFNYDEFKRRIPSVVRAMDNINDIAIYPLPEQKESALNKRRMGLGVTGLANAGESIGLPYGSPEFMSWAREVFTIYRDECYRQSIDLAKEKGPFPLFNAEMYLQSEFAQTLPDDIRDDIARYGIRNSHLLSIAPTGTISNVADNVSSGIEPPFSLYYDRVVQKLEGPKTERVSDYAFREWGVEGLTALEIDVQTHVDVLCLASEFVDSACSKTINVGDDVTWDEFQNVYIKAYEGGASGCTTFRASGKRAGILTSASSEDVVEPTEGAACVYDPFTGIKTCE